MYKAKLAGFFLLRTKRKHAVGLGERYLLEPVCVETRNGKNEDESLVLSCVINIRERITSLLVLDAKGSRGLAG